MSSVLTTKQLMAMKPAAIKRTATQMSTCTETKSSRASRVQRLRAEVKSLEKKHKMTTRKMLDSVCAGKIVESKEIQCWVSTYHLLRAHVQSR